MSRELIRSLINLIRVTTLVNWWSKSDPGDLHLVSATDESHFRSAIQLVESLDEHCPKASIVIYDLGLKAESRRLLSNRGVVVKKFNFDDYPEFFQMSWNHGSYAWKPVIIKLEATESNKRILVWLDAGCKVSARFSKIGSLVQRHKFFANPSSSTYANWLHPSAVAAYVGASILSFEEIRKSSDEIMLSAAFLGFDLKNKEVRRVLDLWERFAHSREIIGPLGSSTENHRFDQVLLDALVRSSRCPIFPYTQAWLPARIVGIETHKDVEVSH